MKTKNISGHHSAWAVVDLRAIRHNFRELKKRAGSAAFLSVVKAEAYGHGMLEVAQLLEQEKTDFFGVADLDEGIFLRQNGIKKPILVFANSLPLFARELVRQNLTATVCTFDLAAALNQEAKRQGKKAKIHVKIDTGMGRLGVWHKEAFPFIASLFRLKNIFLEGIYTHFPVADTNRSFTERQINDFLFLNRELRACGIRIPFLHTSNSAGIVGYKSKEFNLVRAGLMLYGMYPDVRFQKKISLRPALSVKSRLMFLKKVEKGRSISYGRTFIAKRNLMAATIPVGYNDGYLRAFSNKSSVLIDGVYCPVLGRVTMDQIVADVSRVKFPKVGMEVVLLGPQKKNRISADTLACLAGTINYEITCSLGNRLPRCYTR